MQIKDSLYATIFSFSIHIKPFASLNIKIENDIIGTNGVVLFFLKIDAIIPMIPIRINNIGTSLLIKNGETNILKK